MQRVRTSAIKQNKCCKKRLLQHLFYFIADVRTRCINWITRECD